MADDKNKPRKLMQPRASSIKVPPKPKPSPATPAAEADKPEGKPEEKPEGKPEEKPEGKPAKPQLANAEDVPFEYGEFGALEDLADTIARQSMHWHAKALMTILNLDAPTMANIMREVADEIENPEPQ